MYPQRLQIYNAPALEVATIGTFKLAGLFIFSMACLVVAPNVYADESSPLWMTPAGKCHPTLRPVPVLTYLNQSLLYRRQSFRFSMS